MNSSEFLLEVAEALAGCQAVELDLKLYITHALSKARRIINNRVPFKFSGEDYDDASLERLIEIFKKTCNNDDLVKRLGQFKTKRNFLAHKAIAKCIADEEGNLDNLTMAGLHLDLSIIKKDADELINAIRLEHQKLFEICGGIPIPPDVT